MYVICVLLPTGQSYSSTTKKYYDKMSGFTNKIKIICSCKRRKAVGFAAGIVDGVLLIELVIEACSTQVRARTEENIIRPVASLKLASNSINVESCFGTFSLLNISITIAGSVGAIKAANVKAIPKAKTSYIC